MHRLFCHPFLNRRADESISENLLLLLAIASCTQDPTTGTTTVEGQVVAEQSRQPVPNATVQLYYRK